MKIVQVEWADAWIKSGPQRIDSIHCKPALTRTLGYVIKESEDGILICPEYWPKDEYGLNDEGEVSHPIFIPRGMILNIISLGETEVTSDLFA